MKKATYKCGQCGYSSLKIADLHEHMLDYNGSAGYFYDICRKTAFPKLKYDCSLVKLDVHSQTDEPVSIADQPYPDNPEIKDEDSTIVKTELFDVDIDQQNDFEITMREDISDSGLEKNLSFSGTSSSEVPAFSEHGYSIPLVFGYKWKPKKQNRTKEQKPKRTPNIQNNLTLNVAESSRAYTDSQFVGSFQSDDANEDQVHNEQCNATPNADEANHDDGDTFLGNKLEKLIDNALYEVQFSEKNAEKNKCVRRSLVCEICGIEVADKCEWKSHKKSCGRKKHACTICGKLFLRPYLVQQHLRVHTGDRPMVCDQCGKGFKTARMLLFHQRQIHSKERNYKCDKCEKSFKVLPALTRHLRIHNNLLNYSCQFCDKKFSTSWNLKAHVRQHTGMKPYTCSKCGESFTHNVSRKGHEATCAFLPRSDANKTLI